MSLIKTIKKPKRNAKKHVELFLRWPTSLSTKKKVEIICQRVQNKYFLDKDQESLDDFEYEEELDDYIKPTRIVTQEELTHYLTRDMRLKQTKLNWVMQQNGPNFDDFKRKIDNESFKNMSDVIISACELI